MKKLYKGIITGLILVIPLWLFVYSAFPAAYDVCAEGCNYTTPALAAAGVPDNANHTITVEAGTYSGFTDSRNGTSPGYRYWIASGAVTITGRVNLYGDYIKFEGFTIDGEGTQDAPLQVGSYDAPNISPEDHVYIKDVKIYRAGGENSVTVRGTYHTLDGVEIDTPYGTCDGIYMFGNNHLVTGVYYHNSTTSNCTGTAHTDFFQTWGDQGDANKLQNTTIENSYIFIGNDTTGALMPYTSSANSKTGFMLNHCDNITIKNNIIQAASGFNTGGSGVPPITNIKFYNNVVITRTDIGGDYGSGFDLHGDTSTADVKNNVFMNFNTDVSYMLSEQEGGATLTSDYNIFYVESGTMAFADWPSGLTFEQWKTAGFDEHSQVIDPKFTTLYSDFTLQSDSPCIGAGVDLGSGYGLDPGSSWPDNVTAVDQDDYDDGTPGWEIGAYVYDSGTPSATASFSGVSFQ